MTTSQSVETVSTSDLDLRVNDRPSIQEEAKFQSIIKQSDADDASQRLAVAERFAIDPSAINAADDSWVNVVAKVELLQNGNLEDGQRETLVREIRENFRNFQSQSSSIVRQLENYMPTK